MLLRTVPVSCPSCGSRDCLIPRMLGKPCESILDLSSIGLVFLDSDSPANNDANNHWHCKRCFASAALFDDPAKDIAERNNWIDKLLDERSEWTPKQWIEARQAYGFELFTQHLRHAGESIEVDGDSLTNLRACVRTKEGEEIPFPVISETAQLACEHLRERLSDVRSGSPIPADHLFDDGRHLCRYTVQPSFDENTYRMTYRLARSE